MEVLLGELLIYVFSTIEKHSNKKGPMFVQNPYKLTNFLMPSAGIKCILRTGISRALHCSHNESIPEENYYI